MISPCLASRSTLVKRPSPVTPDSSLTKKWADFPILQPSIFSYCFHFYTAELVGVVRILSNIGRIPVPNRCPNCSCDAMQSGHTSSSHYRIAKPTQRTPTCDTCKARHQKCSGEKPACSNCTLRNIKCAYTVFNTSARPRPPAPVNSSSPEGSASRPSISDADYNALYSEIFNDIVRFSGSSLVYPPDLWDPKFQNISADFRSSFVVLI